MAIRITIFERLCMSLLNKTHWFCCACGDFHRFGNNKDKCSNQSVTNLSNEQKQED